MPVSTDRPRSGRKALYPWSEWMDGTEHTITYGVDFHSVPATFLQTMRNKASKSGVSLETSDVGLTAITFRFIPREEDSGGSAE